MRHLPPWAFAAAGLLAVSAAHGFTMGIPGKSQEGCGGAGCHTGGATPTVSILGPATVAPGATVSLRLRVQGGQVAAGANLSASGGVLEPGADGSLRLSGRELVHNGAAAPYAGDAAELQFLWTAPEQAGTVTLFAAGNSVNLDRLPSGDGFGLASASITVGSEGAGGAGGAGGEPPDAGPGAGAPTGGGDDGGCRVSGGPTGGLGLLALLLLAPLRRRALSRAGAG